MQANELQKHLLAVFFSGRRTLGVIGIVFPFILALGGYFYAHLCLQHSMSAYYHATLDGRSMRNVFVGVLFAVGGLLYVYKGYSRTENYVLSLAGVFAIGIALIPMPWKDCDFESCGADVLSKCPDGGFTWHGFFAIAFFVCI